MPELVEVWEPLFWVSPLNEDFSRDLQRAFLESRGEDRIWLSPSAEKVTRWEDRADPRLPFRQCQIPSENWNAISVFHVDEQRNVCPKLSYHVDAIENPRGWEGGLPEALYQKWLN